MMDSREPNLGKAEQEQKEALLPEAILTPPLDRKKNNQQRHQQQRRECTHPPAHWYSAPACQWGPQSNHTFVDSLSRGPGSTDS